jgi:hypothetical protein
MLNYAPLSGTFKLTLQFNEEYPNKPPTVRFISRMFHPNSKLFHLIFKYLGTQEIIILDWSVDYIFFHQKIDMLRATGCT